MSAEARARTRARINNVKPRRMTLNKKVCIVAFTLYITFILLSRVPYIAESHIRGRFDDLDDSYTYHLVFPNDGNISHYYIERVNTSMNGEINLIYTTSSHTLEVETINIKGLTIDCISIYEDESMKVFKQSPSYEDDKNLFVDYFVEERELFTVNVISDTTIEKLRFKSAPEPVRVLVDDEEWWIAEVNYTYDEGKDLVLTHVPKGNTNIQLYFADWKPPQAMFLVTGGDTFKDGDILYGFINKEITFNASESNDNDDNGEITRYEWDFGDDSIGYNEEITHQYSQFGVYTVTLTVTDDHDLTNDISKEIRIISDAKDLDGDGMNDDWESAMGLDPTKDDSTDDFDGDGLTNLQEFNYGIDPSKMDTDGDNYNDFKEVQKGTNPDDSEDYPGKKGADGDDGNLFMYLIIIIIIIIVIVVVMIGIIKKRKGAKEEEEEEYIEEEIPVAEPAAIGARISRPKPSLPAPAPKKRPERARVPAARRKVEVEPVEEIEGELPPSVHLPGAKPAKPKEKIIKEKTKVPVKELLAKAPGKVPERKPPTKIQVKIPRKLPVKMPKHLADEMAKKPPAKEPKAAILEKKPAKKIIVPKMTVKDYVRKGALSFKNGKYEDAIKDWKSALELEPDHPEIVASIKQAEKKLGK